MTLISWEEEGSWRKLLKVVPEFGLHTEEDRFFKVKTAQVGKLEAWLWGRFSDPPNT